MTNKTKFVAVAAMLASLLVVEHATATDVTGRVRLQTQTNQSQSINRYPGRQSVSRTDDYETTPRTQAVVYLIGEVNLETSAEPERAEMKQINQQFKPRVLPILVGTTVDFPNMDPVFHNVFSYSKTKKFDLGRYSRGDSKSITFDRPGIVRVFCEIHSSMLAHIIVLEQPYYTLTERDGSFRIVDVPPGEYELHIWQENAPEQVRTVLVPDQEVFVVEVQ